jgi:hypothetical protein
VVTAFEEPEANGVCRLAQMAAWTGVAGALLSVGGGVAVALAEDEHRQTIGRGVLAGGTALLPPLVAIGAAVTRRHCGGDGHAASRMLGWTGYGGALPMGILGWIFALHGKPPNAVLTVGGSALAAFSMLSHAFDAYQTQRQAQGSIFRVSFGPVTTMRAQF